MYYFAEDIISEFKPELKEVNMSSDDVMSMTIAELQMLFISLYTLRKTNLALNAITGKLKRDSE